MATLSTAARNIFDDLLTLEVNVVLKPGMTARKLPEPVQALLDVMGDYDNWLASVLRPAQPGLDEVPPPTPAAPGAAHRTCPSARCSACGAREG